MGPTEHIFASRIGTHPFLVSLTPDQLCQTVEF